MTDHNADDLPDEHPLETELLLARARAWGQFAHTLTQAIITGPPADSLLIGPHDDIESYLPGILALDRTDTQVRLVVWLDCEDEAERARLEGLLEAAGLELNGEASAWSSIWDLHQAHAAACTTTVVLHEVFGIPDPGDLADDATDGPDARRRAADTEALHTAEHLLHSERIQPGAITARTVADTYDRLLIWTMLNELTFEEGKWLSLQERLAVDGSVAERQRVERSLHELAQLIGVLFSAQELIEGP